jgi:hypothetical protein
MSMPRSSMLAMLLVCGIFTIALGAEGPKLGTDISQQDLAEWDINIQPTGAGLPPGSGTACNLPRHPPRRPLNCLVFH